MQTLIGRKIYFEKTTGNKLVDTGESEGYISPSTIEQDIESYKALSERNRDTFDVIELEYGYLRQDFNECNGYRVKTVYVPFEDELTNPSDDGTIFKIINSNLQYGLSNIVVKVDGEVVETGYTFSVNKVIFDEPQVNTVETVEEVTTEQENEDGEIEQVTEEVTHTETTIKNVTISGVKVAELEFSYPDPNEEEPQEPVYQAPLSEQVATLEQEKTILQLALAETIEKQELDKVSNQLALAELVETLTLKGVL